MSPALSHSDPNLATEVLYDGSDHTLVRDDDILLGYTGDEMTLQNVVPVWDRILVKVSKSSEATASGIVVAPVSNDARASEGEVRRQQRVLSSVCTLFIFTQS